MRLAASTVALVAVLAASPAWAGATAKHSGRIITADPAHQTLTVEGGPVAWLGSQGAQAGGGSAHPPNPD
jgi:hypothetical protein